MHRVDGIYIEMHFQTCWHEDLNLSCRARSRESVYSVSTLYYTALHSLNCFCAHITQSQLVTVKPKDQVTKGFFSAYLPICHAASGSLSKYYFSITVQQSERKRPYITSFLVSYALIIHISLMTSTNIQLWLLW